jgi:bifunctional non-homologous end joining protein LigD
MPPGRLGQCAEGPRGALAEGWHDRGRMLPPIAPQLVSADGASALRAAVHEPERYVLEPKVDGVRALVTFQGGSIQVRGLRGHRRLRRRGFRELRAELEALAERLPVLRAGSTLDGELHAGSFARTVRLVHGVQPSEDRLRLVVFDLPALGGMDLRDEPWERRRAQLEQLARAFGPALRLCPLLRPSRALAAAVLRGDLEGIVIKDRHAPYRSGSRSGWAKLKAPDWDARHPARRR